MDKTISFKNKRKIPDANMPKIEVYRARDGAYVVHQLWDGRHPDVTTFYKDPGSVKRRLKSIGIRDGAGSIDLSFDVPDDLKDNRTPLSEREILGLTSEGMNKSIARDLVDDIAARFVNAGSYERNVSQIRKGFWTSDILDAAKKLEGIRPYERMNPATSEEQGEERATLELRYLISNENIPMAHTSGWRHVYEAFLRDPENYAKDELLRNLLSDEAVIDAMYATAHPFSLVAVERRVMPLSEGFEAEFISPILLIPGQEDTVPAKIWEARNISSPQRKIEDIAKEAA